MDRKELKMSNSLTSPVTTADLANVMKKRAPKRWAKICDQRIERAYGASCSGIQINIMDIGKVFQHGRRQIDMHNLDDAALAVSIREFVETIRRN
jgi:hypothetical protein